ncbi:MAG TPA: metallophosphoesterase [Polyangiaceae bacterium]|nr:metallophosphoesterase [Polyangiaceae bacterium]
MQRATRRLDAWAIAWVLAWSGAWGLLVTERILELHEGPMRTALVSLGFVLIVGSARWATRRFVGSHLRYLPLLILGAIALREGFRRVLRQQYAASPPLREVKPSESLWHPVTTTDLALRYYALSSPKLATERLRVVFLTDLHITRALPPEYYEHIHELVSAQDPDLILMAGDYASQPQNIELVARLFARPWPARFGTFAVLGNHDFWTDPARIRETLSAAGVTFVGNHCQRLPDRAGRIAICGTETPWGPALSAALDPQDLNLALSHTPDNIYRLAEQGASLVFAGHTHAGQLRLPLIGSIVVPSRFGRLFDRGHFKVEGADLFVSGGVGADAPSFRLYCQPEILIVDISRE